jgi:acetylornithine/N-succinyldiaminopimelate aminotransferase
MFATGPTGARADFLTMAKGIAGGFPLGAFALTEEVAGKLEAGDHGGTYCGNPLACAVAEAVISHLVEIGAEARVAELGAEALGEMSGWVERYPGLVTGARGAGLLLLVEFRDEATASAVAAGCLARKVFVRQTQGVGIRVFPALTIKREELRDGLAIVEEAVAAVAG